MKKLIKSPNYHFVGDDKDNWTKAPGRLMFRLSGKSIEKHSKTIDEIVQNENLTKFQKDCIKKRMSSFIHSYKSLHQYLTTQETDVPFQLECADLDSKWHAYLISSRELIDEIGRYIHICYCLKEKTNGLNKKKISSLLENIRKAKKYKYDTGNIEEIISKYASFLVDFISLRDRNKTHRDTLVEAPYLNPSKIPSGGLLVNRNNDKEYEFVSFFYGSNKQLLDFSKKILA